MVKISNIISPVFTTSFIHVIIVCLVGFLAGISEPINVVWGDVSPRLKFNRPIIARRFPRGGAVSVPGGCATSCQPVLGSVPKMVVNKYSKGSVPENALTKSRFSEFILAIFFDESEWCVYFLHKVRCVFESDLVENSSTNTFFFSRYPNTSWHPEVAFF